jgi:hypothetical protein
MNRKFGVMSSVLYIAYLFLCIGYCLVWCRVYCILAISSCTSVTVWCDVECNVYWLSLPVYRLLFGVMSSVLYIDYLFLYIGYCLVWCRVYCILTISSCSSVTVWCDIECTVYWLSLPVHRLLFGVMSSVLYIDYLYSNRCRGRDKQYTVHSTSHQTVTDEQEEIVNIQYTRHHTKQ